MFSLRLVYHCIVDCITDKTPRAGRAEDVLRDIVSTKRLSTSNLQQLFAQFLVRVGGGLELPNPPREIEMGN